MIAKITSFKPTGKYNIVASHAVPDTGDRGTMINMYEIHALIKATMEQKWEPGYYLVEVPGHPHDHPKLLIHSSLEVEHS